MVAFFHKQETYQDPTALNVDSEDFKSLPAEIQHELIKEIKEERKWMNKNDIPRVCCPVVYAHIEILCSCNFVAQFQDKLHEL